MPHCSPYGVESYVRYKHIRFGIEMIVADGRSDSHYVGIGISAKSAIQISQKLRIEAIEVRVILEVA